MKVLVEVKRAIAVVSMLALGGCATSLDIPTRRSLLDVGETWSCWASPQGELACWGLHPADETWWERTHELVGDSPNELVDLQVGRDAACILDRGSRLSCWSGHPDCEIAVGRCFDGPRTLSPRREFAIAGVEKVSLAEDMVCAVFEDQQVRCARLDGRKAGQWQRFGGIRAIEDVDSSVDVGAGHGCAIGSAGEVDCWGANDHCQSEVPELASPDPCVAVELRHGDAIEVLRWSDAEARVALHRNPWRERGHAIQTSGRNLPELEARCLPGHRKPRACASIPPTIQPLPTFEPTLHRLVREAGMLSATGVLTSPDGRVFDTPRVRAHLLDAQGRELGVVDANVACAQLQPGGCPWGIDHPLEPEGTVEVRFSARAELFLPAFQEVLTTIEIELDAEGHMLGQRGLDEIVVTDIRPYGASRDFFYLTVAPSAWALHDPTASLVGVDREGRVVALLPARVGSLRAPEVVAHFEQPESDEIVGWRLRIEGRMVASEPVHGAGSTSG